MVDLADAEVARVGHDDVVVAVHRHADGLVELRVDQAVAVLEALAAGAGQGGDLPFLVDGTHTVVVAVHHDDDISLAAHSNAVRLVELGVAADAVVIAGVFGVPGDRHDPAPGGDLPNAVVRGVRHEDVANVVHCHADGELKTGVNGRAVVVPVARLSGARHGGDHAVGSDLADAVVAGVGHYHVPLLVHGEAHGVEELGPEPDVVQIAVAPRTRHDRHLSPRCNLSNAVVCGVRHDDVSP
eukprot:7425831-Pyramimonas_sp.AAC.1